MRAVYLFLIFLFLFSCATPEVVAVKDPLDEKKNCEELENLVAETQKFKRDALYEKENTGGQYGEDDSFLACDGYYFLQCR